MLEHILDILLQIQECTDETCPGSAFTAVGAAFATQGYYLLSQVVSAIGAGHMEYWGVFLYMFSFFGFMIMIILNGLQIPKNVMWFVLGPALFNFMIYTGTDVKGVMWRVGNDRNLNQKKVWEIAEPGLRNLRPIVSGELDVANNQESTANKERVMNQIRVPQLFVFWDGLISDTVAQLSAWVGADKMLGRSGGGSNLPESKVELGDSSSTSSESDGTAAILANLKWSKLQGIVGARITTSGLRDSFVEFMAGNCGEALKEQIDERALINARRSPLSFLADAKSTNNVGILKERDNLLESLQKEFMTTQGSLKRLFNKCGDKNSGKGGGEGTTLCEFVGEDTYKDIVDSKIDFIECDKTFKIIMKSLRWETGQIYHKIMADWDNGKQQKEKEILKAFYYGWNLDQSGSGATGSEYSGAGGRISDDKLKYFTRDLIFSYLLRNELEFVPKITNVQYSTKVQAEQASDTHIQSLGSQNKFGEIYTWARMMPYIQGILMFILAGAYPIVCIVFLIPGAHKVIITWAAFWAWVKFWDLGFAIVTVIERSVWGMLGNSTHAAAVNNTLANIVEGSGISSIDVTCKSGPLGSCVFPNIKASGGASSAADIFDKGTAIGLSLNYGVYNGYYIYIMAALYMAVPFICGQVILQGKHGVGQLASMMTGGAEKAAGGAAETSAKSKMSADIMNTAGIAKRQVQANEASKYAIKALDAGNKASEFGLEKMSRSSMLSGRKFAAALEELSASDIQNRSSMLGKEAGMLTGILQSGIQADKGTRLKELAKKGLEVAGILGVSVGGSYALNKLFDSGSTDNDSKNNDENSDSSKGQIYGPVYTPGFNPQNENTNTSHSRVSNAASSNGIKNMTASTGATGAGARTVDGMSWFPTLQLMNLPADMTALAGYEHIRSVVNPLKSSNISYDSHVNAQNFDSEANSNLYKGYADRMDTMAKYQGEIAGYEMMQDLAMSNQHIAGVFGANLMPQQKPYDVKGMIGNGEVFQRDAYGKNEARGMFQFFGDENGAGGSYRELFDKHQNSINQTTVGNMNNVFSPGADKIAENATNYSKRIGQHVLSNVGEGVKAIGTQFTEAKPIVEQQKKMDKSVNDLSAVIDLIQKYK
ncbi:MAG: hypothetical protein PUH01_09180 [Pseudomonadota bacterium]|nr:hypothetical protein [Pseudomonadota bacterium]